MNETTRREFLGLAAPAAAVLGGLVLPEPTRAAQDGPADSTGIRPPYWDRRSFEPLTGPTNHSHVFLWDAGETWLFLAGSEPDRWQMRVGVVWWTGESSEPGVFHGDLTAAKKEAERFTVEVLRRAVVEVEKVVYAIRRDPNK